MKKLLQFATYALIVAMLLAFAGCNFSGNGYQADIGITSERIAQDAATQRARIAAEAETERIRINAEADRANAPYLAFSIAVVCLSIVAGSVGIAWSRRPHKPAPTPPMRLLTYAQRYPDTEVCIIDGQWALLAQNKEYRTLAQLDTHEAKRLTLRA